MTRAPSTRRRPVAGERAHARGAVLDRPRRLDPPVVEPRPAEQPRPAAERSRPGRRPARPGGLVLVVAAALVVALVATAALLVVRARGDERVEQARSAAMAAGERHAVTLLSYDHRHLDRDFARAEAVLTGSFADDYAQTTEKVVRPTAEQVKAVVTAEVVSSSVVRASEDRVVLLLFVDQTTTSTRLEGPKVDLNRVRMTLTRTGGEWLVSAVDAL